MGMRIHPLTERSFALLATIAGKNVAGGHQNSSIGRDRGPLRLVPAIRDEETH
jgi:hypothetical protein